ncbi:hypothetical protein GGQ85_000708 [Nitrobacter vulgaris]|nr:hypothetical protein [Nitrobacter vulgaris]
MWLRIVLRRTAPNPSLQGRRGSWLYSDEAFPSKEALYDFSDAVSLRELVPTSLENALVEQKKAARKPPFRNFDRA